MERRIVRHSSRLSAAHETGADAEFRVGQRVRTLDGLIGRVLLVSESFAVGNTAYQVVLDDGMGGGSYLASQLRPVPEAYGGGHQVPAHLPAGVTGAYITEDEAREAWRSSPEAVAGISAEDYLRAQAELEHTADTDYPEMGDVLRDRPDPGRQITVIGHFKENEDRDREDPESHNHGWCHVCKEHHDSEELAEEHDQASTDWHQEYRHLPSRMYRGMALRLPSATHDRVHDPDVPVAHRAQALSDHLRSYQGQLGPHWTPTQSQAEHYADVGAYSFKGNSYSKVDPSVTHVVIHAAKPRLKHIEKDPDELASQGTIGFGYHEDAEIPMRSRAPVRVTGMSWKRDGDDEYAHHAFRAHQEHQAASYADGFDPREDEYNGVPQVGGVYWGAPAQQAFVDEELGQPEDPMEMMGLEPPPEPPAEAGLESTAMATDWAQLHDKIPGEIHRGLYAPESHGVFSAPMSDEDIAHGLIAAHQEEHFPYERNRHQLFGTHWTSDEGVARGFAHEHERAHFEEDDQCPDHDEHSEAAPAVFHAQRPQRHEIEDDPRRLGWQNVDDYDTHEKEVPIRHGAPVRLTGVSWLKHTGLGPMWHRHDFREPVELRAEDRDSPGDPNQWNASLRTATTSSGRPGTPVMAEAALHLPGWMEHGIMSDPNLKDEDREFLGHVFDHIRRGAPPSEPIDAEDAHTMARGHRTRDRLEDAGFELHPESKVSKYPRGVNLLHPPPGRDSAHDLTHTITLSPNHPTGWHVRTYIRNHPMGAKHIHHDLDAMDDELPGELHKYLNHPQIAPALAEQRAQAAGSRTATTISGRPGTPGEKIDDHGDAPGHGADPGHPRAQEPNSYDDASTEGEGDGKWDDAMPNRGLSAEEIKRRQNGAQIGMYPEGISAGGGPGIGVGAFTASSRDDKSDRWHEYNQQYRPDTLHRGVHVQLPDSLHDYVHDESEPRHERAHALAAHFRSRGGLGMHWTPHTQIAHRAIWNAADKAPESQGAYGGYDDDDDYGSSWDEDDEGGGQEESRGTDVMFHVRRPGQRNVVRNPQTLDEHEIGWVHSKDEDEVPLKPGTPLKLEGISWKRHEPEYPNEPFEHHDFDKPLRHTAGMFPGKPYDCLRGTVRPVREASYTGGPAEMRELPRGLHEGVAQDPQAQQGAAAQSEHPGLHQCADQAGKAGQGAMHPVQVRAGAGASSGLHETTLGHMAVRAASQAAALADGTRPAWPRLARVPWTPQERTDLHSWQDAPTATEGDFVPSHNFTNRHPEYAPEPDPEMEFAEAIGPRAFTQMTAGLAEAGPEEDDSLDAPAEEDEAVPPDEDVAPGHQTHSPEADEVFEQLAEDFPPELLDWVFDVDWSGPVAVPLEEVDFSDQESWEATQQPEKVERFREKIEKKEKKGKHPKPAILIAKPSSDVLFIADGHHRALAEQQLEAEGEGDRAEPGLWSWVATVGQDDGPWDTLHSEQLPGGETGEEMPGEEDDLEAGPVEDPAASGPGDPGVITGLPPMSQGGTPSSERRARELAQMNGGGPLEEDDSEEEDEQDEEPEPDEEDGAPEFTKKQALRAFVEAAGNPAFRFEFTAAWRDVVAKAKRINGENGVRITAAYGTIVIGEVKGDHATYESGLQYYPGRPYSVMAYSCGCPWATFHQDADYPGRYNGRLCSHAYALGLAAKEHGIARRMMFPETAGWPEQVVVKSAPPWHPSDKQWAQQYEAPMTRQPIMSSLSSLISDSVETQEPEGHPPAVTAARVLISAGEGRAAVTSLLSCAGLSMEAVVSHPLSWDEIGERHPHLYGDPEVHGEAADGADGEGIGYAANHLANDRPEDPDGENSGSWDLQFHREHVPVKSIDYARHEAGDPRVRHARYGYESPGPEHRDWKQGVPPLVLVHRHGVYQVADGHHRAQGAAEAGRKKVRAYVHYSEHEDVPFSGHDGEPPEKGPFHGAVPHPGVAAHRDYFSKQADQANAPWGSQNVAEVPPAKPYGATSPPEKDRDPGSYGPLSGPDPDNWGEIQDDSAIQMPLTNEAVLHHNPALSQPEDEESFSYGDRAAAGGPDTSISPRDPQGLRMEEARRVAWTAFTASMNRSALIAELKDEPEGALDSEGLTADSAESSQNPWDNTRQATYEDAKAYNLARTLPDYTDTSSTTGTGRAQHPAQETQQPGLGSMDDPYSPENPSIQTVGMAGYCHTCGKPGEVDDHTKSCSACTSAWQADYIRRNPSHLANQQWSGAETDSGDLAFRPDVQEHLPEQEADHDPVAQFHMTSAAQQYRTDGAVSAGVGNADIAAAARAFLQKQADVLPPEEADELIREGRGTRARNLDLLDLKGTHYVDDPRLDDHEDDVLYA